MKLLIINLLSPTGVVAIHGKMGIIWNGAVMDLAVEILAGRRQIWAVGDIVLRKSLGLLFFVG